ncbi:MAG: thiamine diphosphokinase, partial [Anaerolineae bacterium CG_4_8_14_3_um_filter_59_70]
MSKRAVIFANGALPDLEPARRLIRRDDFLIAADGGTRHALALGLLP